MKQKAPPVRFNLPEAAQSVSDTWHNGADVEISLYIESLRKSAKVLIDNLDRSGDPTTAWDATPVVTLYRQAVELAMKMLVGDGCVFLKSPTDHITLATTHSLRWLAQIVRQIIRAVRWEAEFVCAGVADLAEFSALVAEIEEMEPVSAAILADKRRAPGEIPPKVRQDRVLEIAPKLDALVVLLMATADGLAATADLMRIDDEGGSRMDSQRIFKLCVCGRPAGGLRYC